MGRVRGKGKKSTAVTGHEDPGSGGEESLPAYKRRGRPQKPLKNELDEDDAKQIEEEEDVVKLTISTEETMITAVIRENGKKRKRHPPAKEDVVLLKEENGVVSRSNTDVLTNSNGFRRNGSRRKSKPRRAAEAGVECK